MPTERRLDFLGLEFDLVDEDRLVDDLRSTEPASPYRMLVTPNVDHIVRLHRGDQRATTLHRLYSDADICLNDSEVLARLARLTGHELTVVPGSSLVDRLFSDVLKPGDRICIIGGGDRTTDQLRECWPDIEVVQHQPPFGLADKPDAVDAAADVIASSGARFHFIAVGSPQQEMVAEAARPKAGAGGVALCIGAGLEFLVGAKRRAPRWMQQCGLEWLFRLASEPRRLWRRYLVDGPRIFGIAWRWSREQRAEAKS